MALPELITMPFKDLAQIQIVPNAIVGQLVAPFTGNQQIQVHQGQFWQWQVLFPPLADPDLAAMEAFILQANGPERVFLFGDPTRRTPRGTAKTSPGTPVVEGANQLGQEIKISGAPTSVTGWLEPSDYLQIGAGVTARLYKVLTKVDTDSSGEATIDIWPRIRIAHADQTAVTVSSAEGAFTMANRANPWTLTPPALGAIELVIREAF